MAMRSLGGVSITLISRSPTRDMWSVRGIGVAAKVGKLHVFREQSVSADQDVYFSGFHFLQNFFLLLRSAEAADHFDGDWKRRKTLLKRFVVLEGEDRRGRQHRDLLVVGDSF